MKLMTKPTEKNELLLTAYLDGELDSQDRAEAEALLESSPQCRELVQQWRDNGRALQSLPKYKLNGDFAKRLMASSQFAEATKDSQSGINAEDRVSIAAPASNPKQENHFSGLMAIASLAALLMLTLFVFPNFVDNSVAKVNLPSPEKKTEAVEVESKTGADQTPEQVYRPIERVSKNKSIASGSDGGVVAVPSTQPAVEQVLIIKVQSDDFAGVQKVLADNSIKVEDGQADDVEAIYLMSTPSKMRIVINQLASELSVQVTAFPLPTNGVKPGNSTRLSPLTFSSDPEQQKEIVELDRWFGLSGDEDDNKETRFLLLVGQ